MCILIVEDDRDLRALLAEELEGHLQLVFADCGADAIAALDQVRELAAVVSDVDLGAGPDGFAVLRAARAQSPGCARVLVTARADVLLRGVSGDLVDMVFGKPWGVGAIRRYLAARIGGDWPPIA